MQTIELEKNLKLQDFLRDLSIECYEESILFEKSRILLEIYTDDFRHGYFYIFSVMVEIKNLETRDAKQVIEALQTNLSCLKDQMPEHKEFSGNIYKCFSKFCDHTMLEISRLQHWGNIIKKQTSLEEDLERANEELRKANEMLKKTHEEVKNSKLEVVGILSIFAAIVFVFMGGVSFMGNAVSAINQASIYRFSFMLIICGIIMLNIIACLLHIVAKILDKNIYFKCTGAGEGDCFSGNKNETCSKGCKWRIRLKRKFPYIYRTNRLLLWGLAIIFLLWISNVCALRQKLPWVDTHKTAKVEITKKSDGMPNKGIAIKR